MTCFVSFVIFFYITIESGEAISDNEFDHGLNEVKVEPEYFLDSNVNPSNRNEVTTNNCELGIDQSSSISTGEFDETNNCLLML